MIGPGKYDDLCTYVRERTKAKAVLVIVIDGEHGSGFSCQGPTDVLVRTPRILNEVAANMIVDFSPGSGIPPDKDEAL